LDWKDELYGKGIVSVDEPEIEKEKTKYEIFGDISVMELTVNHINALMTQYNNPGPARWLHPDLVTKPRVVVNYVRGGSYGSDVLMSGAVVSKVNGKEVRTLQDFRNAFFPATASSSAAKKPRHVIKSTETLEMTAKGKGQGKNNDGEGASSSSGESLLLLQETEMAAREDEQHAGAAAENKKMEVEEQEDMIWTLETDLGKLYAVMFKQTLKMQLQAGQMGESYMLSDMILGAGQKLGWVKEKQPQMLNEKLATMSMNGKTKSKTAFVDASFSFAEKKKKIDFVEAEKMA